MVYQYRSVSCFEVPAFLAYSKYGMGLHILLPDDYDRHAAVCAAILMLFEDV